MGPFATDTLCQPPHLGAVGVRGWGVGGAIKQWIGPPGADIDGLRE